MAQRRRFLVVTLMLLGSMASMSWPAAAADEAIAAAVASAHFGRLAFDAIYAASKPGGVLGVVDHRWPDPATEDPLAGNGYISAERTIALAGAAGFKLLARSDINPNPADTRDCASGVWTLPPTLALGDKDRDRYPGIGESDRFTLKFVKPLE